LDCLKEVSKTLASGITMFDKCKFLKKHSLGRKRCYPWQASFVIVDPPGWALASAHVRTEVDALYESQKEANVEKDKERDQQCIIDKMKQEEDAIAARCKMLLTDYQEKQQRCKGVKDLNTQFDSLREKAHLNSEELAQLRTQLEQARSERESQESDLSDATAKTDEVVGSLDKLKGRPATEFEGRATAQELAALERSIAKGDRDLYALQMKSVEALRPLAPPSQTAASKKKMKLKACVERYADVRREVLHEWARPRLTRLEDLRPAADSADNVASSKKTAKQEPVAPPLLHDLHRLQQLQQKIVGLKAMAKHEVDAATAKGGTLPAAPSSDATKGSSDIAHMKLKVPVPKWVGLRKPTGALQASHKEVRQLHRSVM